MKTLRIAGTLVLCFLSLIAIMKLLTLLNKGNVIICCLSITGVVILFSLIIESRLFTKNPFKTKKEEKK
jgi:hypothetical protein